MITEIFMTPSYIMGYLCKIKNAFPDIKFICEGGPEQTRPVKEEHIDWVKSKLLFNLCDGNMVQLRYNKRNNETENYYKILRGEALDPSKYGDRVPQEVNICRTNKMREAINKVKMNKEGHFVAEDKKLNPKSQDMYLKLDTPIMCVKSSRRFELKNGKMYSIEQLISSGKGHPLYVVNGIEYTEKIFVEHFVVAFAYTNHKVQGITIRVPFNIYEWDSMSRRERYTAYSRTSDGKNVKMIAAPGFGVEEEAVNYSIYKWSCLNDDCNHIYVGSAKDVAKRRAEHVRACEDATSKYHNVKLYKYMRANGGVHRWRMEVLEEFHAASRRQAEEVEQKWIEELQPSLNMCAAAK